MEPETLLAISAQLRTDDDTCGNLELVRSVSGGDIHTAWIVRVDDRMAFLKCNRPESGPLFEAEREALQALAASNTVRVPQPWATGSTQHHAWLLMDYLALSGSGDTASAHALGARLAALHAVHGHAFGWRTDNFIGTTPQRNTWSDSWVDFWTECRILPQLDRAERAGHPAWLRKRAEHMLAHRVPALLDHRPPPSLLHGDLWGGNHGYLADGTPVVFDPASHYGDRETDLAMMRLFGGFHPAVFDAYRLAAPLPCGFHEREPLYQVYHVLNHLNLFGTGWLPRLARLFDTLGS